MEIWLVVIFFLILVVCWKFCLQIADVYSGVCILPLFNDISHLEFGSLLSYSKSNGIFEENQENWSQTQRNNFDYSSLDDISFMVWIKLKLVDHVLSGIYKIILNTVSAHIKQHSRLERHGAQFGHTVVIFSNFLYKSMVYLDKN